LVPVLPEAHAAIANIGDFIIDMQSEPAFWPGGIDAQVGPARIDRT
jgi:hypothetical protein